MSARRKVSITAPRNGKPAITNRIMIGTPTLGVVRIEWHNAMSGIVIPTNWSNSAQTPIGYGTADAQNIICHEAISKGFDWVLFIEDDVIVPLDIFIKLRRYMESRKYPVVAGLYHVKCIPPEPMVYRGRGNGAYTKWKLGDVVEVDGLPTGCTLISVKLLKAVAAHKDQWYTVQVGEQRVRIRRIFETPRHVWSDPKTGAFMKNVGTSDLVFCDYVLQHRELLAQCGWKALSKKKYPFIVDTRIHCAHIDRETGRLY